MDSWKDSVRFQISQGKSWREIAESSMHYFPNETYSQVYERVRHIDKSHHRQNHGHGVQERRTATLVFSDTHMPFNHPNYLQFLKDVYREKNCGHVVCLGDLVDHHAVSRFETEPCADGQYVELDKAIVTIKQYVEAFPNVKMCIGNHDTVPVRQAKSIGLGGRFLKSFRQLYEIPDSWEIEDEFIIDNVLYTHGINCTGKTGAIDKAVAERMSTCIGHSHSYAGCQYEANARSIIFGLNTGCGIHIKTYAFVYGKHDKRRPVIGCGVVYNDSSADFIAMPARYFQSA